MTFCCNFEKISITNIFKFAGIVILEPPPQNMAIFLIIYNQILFELSYCNLQFAMAMAMAKAKEDEDHPKRHRIFTCGTLKTGFANHNLMQDLMINHNHAVFLGKYSTHLSFPLLLGPYAIPYLINLPGSDCGPVRGEVCVEGSNIQGDSMNLEMIIVCYYYFRLRFEIHLLVFFRVLKYKFIF